MTLQHLSAETADRQFRNADSFAIAFDDAWRRYRSLPPAGQLSRTEAFEQVLADLAEHPFCQMDASRAREVGEFRLRLLGV